MDVIEHAEYGRLYIAVAGLIEDHARECRCVLYRFVQHRYARGRDFLSGQGTLRAGTRFGAASTFPIVYGSTDPRLALEETCQEYKYYGVSSPPLHHVIRAFECSLAVTLDLRTPEIRKFLGVTIRTLSEEDWRRAKEAGEESLTQAIGRAAHANRVQALLVPSALSETAHNVAVFPDNLVGTAYMKLVNLTPGP